MLPLIYNVTRFVPKNSNMSVLRIVVYVIYQIHVIFIVHNYIDKYVPLCVVNLKHTWVK